MSVHSVQPMTDTNQPNGKERRILDAAVEVFGRKGYHASTVADVAAEAGVAAGTIYLYFARKEEILISLFKRHLGGYMDACEPALAAEAAGEPRLRKLLEQHFEHFEPNRSLAKVLMVHAREVNPTIQKGIRALQRRYFAIIESVLEAGRTAGAFASDLDVRFARRFLFGALEEVVANWVYSKRGYSLTSRLEPFHRMTVRALGAGAQTQHD